MPPIVELVSLSNVTRDSVTVSLFSVVVLSVVVLSSKVPSSVVGLIVDWPDSLVASDSLTVVSGESVVPISCCVLESVSSTDVTVDAAFVVGLNVVWDSWSIVELPWDVLKLLTIVVVKSVSSVWISGV